ncbi:MAG TPA: 3-hydroxyacyl-CoA dehydrogenase/enoyl-CoA hydratase family protein [Gemmatimonadaceae bacterium]
MRVTKVGVVGAGVMGSGIAALAASAGVPTVLLDVPAPADKGGRNGFAKAGLERARKARPAAFMDPGSAALITIGNTEDDLGLLAGCDLVIEAIIEQPGPKQALYERLEALLPDTTIIATNTSGIPMRVLLEGRSASFRKRFLGMHFFNPPRYLHLLELIPTPETGADTLAAARRFSERTFGKGIVVAKDVPGFVANRLGVYGLLQALRLMEEFDLTIDEVDALTGPVLGRPKSAVFRTGDITGIDVLRHVVVGLTQATKEDFALPPWVDRLIESGRIGEKSGAGFYRKEGKAIQTLDWKTLEYGPQRAVESPELQQVAKLRTLRERLEAIRTMPGKYGDFLRKYLLLISHYVLEKSPMLAFDIDSVDHGLEWGYGWEAGPFRMMDYLGLDFLRDGFRKLGLSLPPLLEQARDGFYRPGGDEEEQLGFDGHYAAVEAPIGTVTAAALRQRKCVLEETKDAALLDMGDGVALLEFRAKMNTLGQGTLEMLRASLDRIAREGMCGLVIGNDDPRTFTAGANLMEVAGAAQQGDWTRLEQAIRYFQDCSMAIRQSPFPVVSAPFGLTLGGGAEFSLHADRIQAHAELYMGLVEVGVGLLPGGGGTKELLFRFTEALQPYEEADPFEGVKRAFKLIAMAATSTSAFEARTMGFLQDHDRISMNRDRLLADAKHRVLDLSTDYVPPTMRTIRTVGGEAIGNLYYALFAFQEGGQASDHDVVIGRKIAYVLCGGDGPPRLATEQDILDLEREAFLQLLGTKETQERIAHMLKTGKPLRN